MEWLNELTQRLRILFRHGDFDRELEEEMRLHREMRAADEAARGADAGEARAAAQRRFGNATRMYERSREVWGWIWLEQFLQDVSYGCRSMLRTPGFTAVTIVTLAIGIGATTAIFSAVNPILFKSLPYPGANRIMMISDFADDGSPLDVTFHTFRELTARSHSFEATAVVNPWQPTLTGATQPLRLDGQLVSEGYFRTLGMLPSLGRNFETSEDRVGGPRVVILSHALWQQEFGADTTLIGRAIKLNDDLYTVVGVMPAGFENILNPAAEIWRPLQYDARNITTKETTEWGHHLEMIARLRPGITREQATAQLDSIAQNPVSDFPAFPGPRSIKDCSSLRCKKASPARCGLRC